MTAVGTADASGRVKPAYCASACVLVYAGGKTRFGVLGSALGVHRFVTTKPVSDPVAETQRMPAPCWAIMTKMGVSSSIVEAMSETRDIRWLSPKQALAMNLVTDPARQALSQPAACPPGLNPIFTTSKPQARACGKNLPSRAFLVPPAAEFSYARTREPALRTQAACANRLPLPANTTETMP